MREAFKISPRILKRRRHFGGLDMDGNIVVHRSLNKYLYISDGFQLSQKTKECDLH
jgi:hypothetical protein